MSELKNVTAQEAFGQYHRAVYSFAYRLTRRADISEDITQECFLTLLRTPERFDPRRGTMRTFLFSIARNLALKRYRDENSEGAAIEPAVDPRDGIDLAAAVAEAVAALPQLQQEALVLFQYEGVTLEEIAVIVGADVGTVKSRLFRARQRLRQVLAPYQKLGSHHGTST